MSSSYLLSVGKHTRILHWKPHKWKIKKTENAPLNSILCSALSTSWVFYYLFIFTILIKVLHSSCHFISIKCKLAMHILKLGGKRETPRLCSCECRSLFSVSNVVVRLLYPPATFVSVNYCKVPTSYEETNILDKNAPHSHWIKMPLRRAWTWMRKTN